MGEGVWQTTIYRYVIIHCHTYGNPSRKRHMPNEESRFTVNNRLLITSIDLEIAWVVPSTECVTFLTQCFNKPQHHQGCVQSEEEQLAELCPDSLSLFLFLIPAVLQVCQLSVSELLSTPGILPLCTCTLFRRMKSAHHVVQTQHQKNIPLLNMIIFSCTHDNSPR